ncbi:MAG: NUDIX domain-containing protein [Moorea sp. SIO2B7]|nr:NUDIX domain-containing protein [Moorena sp. SIO2B7]
MNNQPIAVAIAILYQQGRFLLQLRDDIPGILYPGHWGLFGGHIESGETPDEALRRELVEEINYSVSEARKFRCYSNAGVIRHVYHSPLRVAIDELILKEGWDLDLVTANDIRLGSCYSQKAAQIRPLGTPHQQILLDFIETKLWED